MSGGGKRGNGVALGAAPSSIPAGSRKMVQSLKEIVNCSDAEIYAMLKECNMDPSEAVHRLLTQDTFHEVKSKREKKKETKDIPESRSRPVSNNSNRGRASSNQSGFNDYGVVHGKPSHKKDNGTIGVLNISNAGTGSARSNLYRKPTTLCEVVSMQNTTQPAYVADGPPLPSQSPSGIQNNWSRTPGQMSMADIVKMGRPQGRTSSTPSVTNDTFNASRDSLNAKRTARTALPSESAQEFHYSQGSDSLVEETTHELVTGVGHHGSHDDWPLFEKKHAGTGSGSTHPETCSAPVHDEPSGLLGLSADEVYLQQARNLDDIQLQEGDANGNNLQPESNWSEPIYDRQIELDNSGDSTHLDDDSLNGMISYQSQRNELEYHEVRDDDEEISSTAAILHQLDIHKGELDAPPAANNPAVIIPSHLQVTNADCSHLSFGSFGAAAKATSSGQLSSKSPRNNLEMAPVAEDVPSLDQLNSRNPEYYDEDQLQATLNDNVISRASTSTGSYDAPSASQPEIIREDTLDAAHGLRENFPSVSGYEVSATTQPAPAAYTYADPNSQMHNLSPPFSSLMQPYGSSLQSGLLAPSVQAPRELDFPLSALLANQSAKYNAQTPSISGPISTPEVKQEPFSAPQLTPQALPSSSPAIPQHLMHPYSQPTLPLGHFANMIGYPFLPQSYAFLPSASFPQAYTSNSPFQQSAAASLKYNQLPQYKSSNLPQSPALPAGYGGFTGSTNNIAGYGGFTSSSNVPAGFSVNPSSVSASTMGFEDALSSQYKDGSHYLQQNENSAMWLQGANSRAASALLGNTFYGIQAHQNQQNGGFRQSQQQQQQQQQSSPYAQMNYMNYYQSQGAPAQEQHHQQNSGEGNLSGSQGPTSHQLWQQHGY